MSETLIPKKRKTIVAYDGKETNYEELRQEDARPIRGIFRSLIPVGGSVNFYFRKWKGDPVEKYELRDGETYTLPKAVVKHLQENCWEPMHAFSMDENNRQSINKLGKKIKRFTFEPTDY